MPILHINGWFRVILAALLISASLVLAILILFGFPSLRTPDSLNLFLTVALASFAGVETVSTILQHRRDKERKRTVDLRNELEKLYGPVYSVLNDVVYKELRTVILTPDEKKLADETFSVEPTFFSSQTDWKNKMRNREMRKTGDYGIPIEIIESFNNDYERKKGDDAIEKQFGNIYSVFKNAPQEVEEVGILQVYEKNLVDKKFSNYPYMLNQDLYDYWNNKIRSLKITIAWEAFGDSLTLLENLKFSEGSSTQNTPGVYRVPKAFIKKFLEEYESKVHEYNKL